MNGLVTGIVLAGGRSSRMGCEKALLPVGTQLLIERVIEHLVPLVDHMIVVGHESNARLLAERLDPAVVEAVVTDCSPHEGPLMGVYTGLMHSQSPWNLLVPCDMPWADTELLRRFLTACRRDARVVAARHPQGGIQTFPLACHRSVCRLVGALLDGGQRAVRALLREPCALLLPLAEAECPAVRSVNTFPDYERLCDELTVTPHPVGGLPHPGLPMSQEDR